MTYLEWIRAEAKDPAKLAGVISVMCAQLTNINYEVLTGKPMPDQMIQIQARSNYRNVCNILKSEAVQMKPK